MSDYHTPVLLQDSVTALVGADIHGVYIDATFGGGGHSREILSRLSSRGRLLAFDRDSDALLNRPEDSRLELIHDNFRFVHNHLMLSLGRNALADGILADLGVSSHQFDTAERGFSFRFDAPLDMRMNRSAACSAEDIVNQAEEERLERIFRLWGELPQSRRMASLIVRGRTRQPIRTTAELCQVLSPLIPPAAPHKTLAKVFQALRIEVNDEMRSLEKFLQGAAASLRTGGRLVVITYHSLEDRMVKNFIRSGNVDGKVEKDLYGRVRSPWEPQLKKPLVPSEEEIAVNPRARSAKLRVALRKREEEEERR